MEQNRKQHRSFTFKIENDLFNYSSRTTLLPTVQHLFFEEKSNFSYIPCPRGRWTVDDWSRYRVRIIMVDWIARMIDGFSCDYFDDDDNDDDDDEQQQRDDFDDKSRFSVR